MEGEQPYKDLYIYLFKGVLEKDHEAVLGEAFIGNWVEADTSFLFFSSPAHEILAAFLKKYPEFELIENFQFTYEQWQGGRLSRIEVADFEVLTPWEASGDGEEWNRILIDPGVVFGNGLHPTTQDCLRALVYAADKRPFERVLDLGTGTGILSVAAALLGASEVLAVDLNPLCAKTAKRNAELNHQKEKIEVVEGSAEGFFDKAADLVVANIHYEVIQKLVKARRFCPKERLVVSGLMRSQVRDVKEQMGRSRINVVKEWDRDMTWFTILAEIG